MYTTITYTITYDTLYADHMILNIIGIWQVLQSFSYIIFSVLVNIHLWAEDIIRYVNKSHS